MSRAVVHLALALALGLAIAEPSWAAPALPPASLSLQAGKETPRYALERLSPTQCRLWLRAIAWPSGEATTGRIAGAAWRAEPLGAIVLVDFQLAAPGEVGVAYDQGAKQLVLYVRPEAPLALPPEIGERLSLPKHWEAPPVLPVPPAATFSLVAGQGLSLLSESLASGLLDVGPALVPTTSLSAELAWPEGPRFDGRLRYAAYTLQDAATPESLHRRDGVALDMTGAYPLPLGDRRVWLGAGYSASYLAVGSTLPSPLSQPLLFSPTQLFHGPRLLARWEPSPIAGWRAGLELCANPYMLAAGDAAVSSLSPLYAYGARVGVAWAPEPAWAIALNYPVSYLTGYAHDFFRLEHGPELTGSWRF